MLRIIAFVAGETIKWLQLEIGLLHRGTEKLIEYKTYNQSIPYFNRLDYVSLIAQEEIYINNIEKLLNLRISRYGSVVRTIFLEISRILNHLLAVTILKFAYSILHSWCNALPEIAVIVFSI